MLKHRGATLVAAALLLVAAVQAAPAVATERPGERPGVSINAKEFKNCTALNKVYKHGVGKRNARDKTSGTPVTTFKRDNALYNANDKSDRDKDGIACEKK